MCDECAILRDHYPRDPEIRMARAALFFPSCMHCGARYLQWIKRKLPLPVYEKKAAYERVYERWERAGHNREQIKALGMDKDWAVAPATKGARR